MCAMHCASSCSHVRVRDNNTGFTEIGLGIEEQMNVVTAHGTEFIIQHIVTMLFFILHITFNDILLYLV